MQTTLLGLAMALILALIAALVGPFFIDWNQFRPQFEAEASRVVGAPVRVEGALDARLLPTPTLRLRGVSIGGSERGRARADKLDVEFNLSALMRGEWRASELTINGLALDLGLDPQGRIEGPAPSAVSNLGALAIDRMAVTGKIVLHDAASGSAVELNDLAFSGDVRPAAGSLRGDGNVMVSGTRYPFRLSSGRTPDGSATRVHLSVEPGQRALALDLDGLLTFDARAPRFDGAISVALPSVPKAKAVAGEALRTPWKIAAKLKADPKAARFEQIDASYGEDEVALKFAGLADLGFGAAPKFHAVLSARQLDVDRLLARDNAAEPLRLLPTLRGLIAALPPAPLPTQIEIGAEQIMLGGRAVQNVGADLHGDSATWSIDRLELRAPGGSQLALSGVVTESGTAASFKGALSLDAADPELLTAWLLGRSDGVTRGQKPLKMRGDLSLAAAGFAIERLNAGIDGSVLEGRVALTALPAGAGSRFDAALKADQLDLDAALALARSLAGPQSEWPLQGTLSLDLGRAATAGQLFQPLQARLSYGPAAITLEQLKIGAAGGLLVDGAGAFDRTATTGKLGLNANAASLTQLAGALAPLAPAVATRLSALGTAPGPARIRFALDLAGNPAQPDRAKARGVLEIDAPQLKGDAVITATPAAAAIRGTDLDALLRSELAIETRLSAPRGQPLLALLGLDRLVAAGEGPARLEASMTGAWRAPLQIKAKLTGSDLDADLQGRAEPFATKPGAVFNLAVRRANLAPAFDLKPADAAAWNLSLSSRLTMAGDRLSFDDVDGAVAGSRLRGRLALTLGDENAVEGEAGVDTVDLAAAIRLAIGAAGHAGTEPLGRGLMQGWRGQLAFQALRGGLPGGIELQPVSGVIRSDGRSLTLDGIKGRIGGGDLKADLTVRQAEQGLALNAHLDLAGVDGSALRYRSLAMPNGRASMQMTLSSLGRSASALTGALSGDGSLTLQSAAIPGLDPRAFEAAVLASEAGKATDPDQLAGIVEPVLASGSLPVPLAQFAFNIREGRLRVDPTTLTSQFARATVSGGYDVAADQADLRANLVSTMLGTTAQLPELQVFAAGSPDHLLRSVDLASLSNWLAMRSIDREIRKFEKIERDETAPAPASIPPAAIPPIATAPTATAPPTEQPGVSVAPPSASLPPPEAAAPRRPPIRPRITAPRPPREAAAPLPPPIEVRPAPAPSRPPRPGPPMVLTPPSASPPRTAF